MILIYFWIIEVFCNTPKLLEFILKSSKDTFKPLESTSTVNFDDNNSQTGLDYYLKYEGNANDNLNLDLIKI